LIDKDELTIDWIKPGTDKPTLERIREHVVDRGPYHLFHYFGHGSGEDQGRLYLESGRPQDRVCVGWRDLGAELRDTRTTLRLVVLNACELAQVRQTPGEGDEDSVPAVAVYSPFNNLATRLLDAGAAMVVAMQYPIRTETAHQFTRAFYSQLWPDLFASASAIEQAVCAARGRIGSAASSVEWITPVVFSRMDDDVILELSQERLERYKTEREMRAKVNRLLNEVQAHYNAKRWPDAAAKVLEILEADASSEAGLDWKVRLLQECRDLLPNPDAARVVALLSLSDIQTAYEAESWERAAEQVAQLLVEVKDSEEAQSWKSKLLDKVTELAKARDPQARIIFGLLGVSNNDL
jgi:hypothetical protein